MRAWILVAMCGCGGGGDDMVDLCANIACSSPPANDCTHRYDADGTCMVSDGTAFCTYPVTVSDCDSRYGFLCVGTRCQPSDGGCHSLPTDSCTDTMSCQSATVLQTQNRTCSNFNCFNDGTPVAVDCSQMAAPPPNTCNGTTLVTYAPTATCASSPGTATCSYASTSVNCAATNQVCDPLTLACM